MASVYKVLGQTTASTAPLTMTNFIGDGTTTVTGTVADTTGYAVGNVLNIVGAAGTEQAKLNGIWIIASVPTGTTFTFVVASVVTAGTYTTALGATVRSAPSNLYTVPAATSTVCSTLVICNQGITTTYRVAVRPAGATVADQHYLIYDNYINQFDSVFLTLGISLATTDVVTVSAGSATVSFSLFGSELT